MTPRFRLHTFGTLRLAGPSDDAALGRHGHQRRRLALLAVLAAAGSNGRTRDQLLALFWPEVPQRRARHSLEQMLYALRGSLDSDIVMRVDPLRLDASVIDSDVGDFTAAVARGDLEMAVAAYRGPFLDGFHLNDAASFDEWMESERARLRRIHMEVVERLARNATAAGEFPSAVRWWRLLVESDPLSSGNAAALVSALNDTGDHTAALREAERHREFVKQELGTDPGPAFAALIAKVRADMSGAHDSAAPTQVDAVRASAASEANPGRTPRESGPSAHAGGDVPPVQGFAAPTSAKPIRRRRATAWLALPLIIVLLLVGGALLESLRSTESATPAPPLASIVVLPLVNLGESPSDVVLADGITEELIGVLARVERLHVIARTSSFAFRNSPLDVRRIADTLRVAHVLEGSMQRRGDAVRVRVRLIDARDGATRWAEDYDREIADIFAVQRDIAGAVARELNLRLGGADLVRQREPPSHDVAAYEFYLRGSDPALLRSDSGARAAVAHLERAIAIDTAYAAAYAALAILHGRLSAGRMADAASRLRLARANVDRAMAIDSTLSDVRGAAGVTAMSAYRFGTAERELRRALELDPANGRAREWLSQVELWLGHPADALAQARRAVETDPLSPSARAELGRALCATGRFAEGLEELGALQHLQPPLLRLPLYQAACNVGRKDWSGAIAVLQLPPHYYASGLLGYALARAGRRDAARGLLDTLRAEQGSAFQVALIYLGLGDRDRSIEWLARSLDDRSFLWHHDASLFDELRGDPRYVAFRSRLTR